MQSKYYQVILDKRRAALISYFMQAAILAECLKVILSYCVRKTFQFMSADDTDRRVDMEERDGSTYTKALAKVKKRMGTV